MAVEIGFGTFLLIFNITLAAAAAMVLEVVFVRLHPWLIAPPHHPKLVLLVAGVSLWVLGVITLGVWIWASAYILIGVFHSLEEAVYFSLVCFTTLGLGDIVIPKGWRILSGMEAANGFLNFGLLCALLVEALRQIRLSQVESRRKGG